MQKTVGLLVVVAAISCAGEKTRVTENRPAPLRPSGRTEIGDIMPAYSGKYLDGKPLRLDSEKGRVVFLNVWATWCGPCRAEIPELQELQHKYAARHFEVIGISVDEGSASDVRTFVKDQKIDYPIGLDASGRIADLLHTTVLPTSLIIGADGHILWRSVGAMTPDDVTAVESVVERALPKS